MSKTQFRKRVRGTPKQIGQPFPVVAAKISKPIFERRALTRGRMPLTPVEKHALKAEEELIASGFKGWNITIKLKDGKVIDVPLIAKTWDEAMRIAKSQMQKYNPKDIEELVITDPKISEVLHKMGAGARRVAGAIGRGAWRGVKALARVPSAVERAGIRVGRAIGRIEAVPAEIREAYEEAKAERPWEEEPGEVKEYIEREPEPEPVVKRLPPRVAREVARREVRTEAEWKAEPTPEIYKPAEPAVDVSRPFAAPSPFAGRAARYVEKARKEIRALAEPKPKRRTRVIVEGEPVDEGSSGGKRKLKARPSPARSPFRLSQDFATLSRKTSERKTAFPMRSRETSEHEKPFWKQTRRAQKGYRIW
jgi:hypothetical protein